jgi:hypothetical protein
LEKTKWHWDIWIAVLNMIINSFSLNQMQNLLVRDYGCIGINRKLLSTNTKGINMKKIPHEYSFQEIEKMMKPNLIMHICSGLIFLGPYLNFFRIIFEKSYDELLIVVILTGITLPLFTLNWVWYFYDLKHYKAKSKKIYEEILSIKE